MPYREAPMPVQYRWSCTYGVLFGLRFQPHVTDFRRIIGSLRIHRIATASVAPNGLGPSHLTSSAYSAHFAELRGSKPLGYTTLIPTTLALRASSWLDSLSRLALRHFCSLTGEVFCFYLNWNSISSWLRALPRPQRDTVVEVLLREGSHPFGIQNASLQHIFSLAAT